MKLFEWYLSHKKLAYKLMGANFLLMALVLLFWSAPKEGMSENERAAANVARMEARIQGQGSTSQENKVNLLNRHMDKQQAQLRIVLVIMVIVGVGFLAYGVLKKEENQA